MDNKTINFIVRSLLIVGMVVYIVCPIDGLPGPVDDIVVAILGVVGNKALASKASAA